MTRYLSVQSPEPSEDEVRHQEAGILQLGEQLREEGRASEMTELITKVMKDN